MNPRKYLIITSISIIALLIALSLTVYLWDPYSYYRIEDGRLKYVASSYINAGIIRNADYDSVIIGSSMSQNFNPETFRELIGVNPVKLCTGGLTLEQRDLFFNAVERQSAGTDKFFIEIQLSTFNSEDDDLSDTPLYLYDDNKLNDFRYLLGYETWARGMPVSFGYAAAKAAGIEMDTMHNIESVDNVGDWYPRYKLGREQVINKYKKNIDAVSYQETDGMYERMCKNVDEKLCTVIEDKNEYVFFFPPYSALFWHKARQAGYEDCYFDVKEHIMEVLSGYDNVSVFDFQSDPLTSDLDNYRDTSHYGRHISE
ncbi:MAG: hypothetical protein K5696_01780, partial [Lachnospiraceae bacterium]|nr:hypothetical protein [Lachnospiraceae bacterium]